MRTLIPKKKLKNLGKKPRQIKNHFYIVNIDQKILQLVVNGSATQGDIRRAFGVPKVAVQRAVDKYRCGGAAAFFVPPQARSGRKLTPEVLPQVQARLDQSESVPEISRQTGVLANTIHKAIRAGRLREGAKKKTLGLGPTG